MSDDLFADLRPLSRQSLARALAARKAGEEGTLVVDVRKSGVVDVRWLPAGRALPRNTARHVRDAVEVGTQVVPPPN